LRHKTGFRWFRPQFGAGPLKRVAGQLVESAVYEPVQGEFKPGEKIKVTADGDELVFKAK